MGRDIVYAVICFVACIAAWRLGIAIWLLFLAMGLYYAFRSIKRTTPPQYTEATDIAYGEIRRFNVEGERALGLYLKLAGRPVFVDIREDQLAEKRKLRALELSKAESTLEVSLSSFLINHPEFQERQVGTIGIHSNDLQQAEVFWEPTGYTLIRGLTFVSG